MSIAFNILLNILMFSAATFGTSIIIEKYYKGRMKWVIVPLFTLLSSLLIIKTDFMLKVLFAITGDITLQRSALILLGGIIIGIFISFL